MRSFIAAGGVSDRHGVFRDLQSVSQTEAARVGDFARYIEIQRDICTKHPVF